MKEATDSWSAASESSDEEDIMDYIDKQIEYLQTGKPAKEKGSQEELKPIDCKLP